MEKSDPIESFTPECCNLSLINSLNNVKEMRRKFDLSGKEGSTSQFGVEFNIHRHHAVRFTVTTNLSFYS